MAWRGASASTWLRVGWFPSTLVWFEHSWASKLAAQACMAAWLREAAHREMRAAARDVCKSGGACRALGGLGKSNICDFALSYTCCLLCRKKRSRSEGVKFIFFDANMFQWQ